MAVSVYRGVRSGGTWLAGLFAIAAAGLTYWALRKLRAF